MLNLLQILCSRWWGGKCLASSRKNSLPILVLTCLLNGGLNNVMLRFLFFFFSETRLSVYSSLPVCPLRCIASSYSGTALENSLLSHESCDRRVASISGSCFLMTGGWLDKRCIYRGWLLGLRKGQYLPDLRSKVTSRKLVWTRLVSAVIFKPWC